MPTVCFFVKIVYLTIIAVMKRRKNEMRLNEKEFSKEMITLWCKYFTIDFWINVSFGRIISANIFYELFTLKLIFAVTITTF